MKNYIKILLVVFVSINLLYGCTFNAEKIVNDNAQILTDMKNKIEAEIDDNTPNLISENENNTEFTKINFGMQDGKPISWYIVLDDDENQILLSEKIIDTMPYNTTAPETNWGSTTLHEYLNTDFINECFSKEERDKIIFTNDTENDMVTMPTFDNLIDLYGDVYYLPDDFYNKEEEITANKKITAIPNDKALYNEIEVFDNELFAEIMRQKKVDTRYDFANGNSAYWVLNKTDDNKYAFFVTATGYVNYTEPNTNYIGIRPIIRIKK